MLHPLSPPKIVTYSTNSATANKPQDIRLKKFNEFLNAKSFSKNTIRTYINDIQYFLKFTQTDWKEITIQEFINYKNYLLTPLSKNKKCLKDATVTRALNTVKSFYQWLYATDQIEKDVTLSVSYFSPPNFKTYNLDSSQIQIVFQTLEELAFPERNLPVFGLMLHGLRRSEVCGLNIEDYKNNKVYIKNAKCNSVGFVPLENWCIDYINYYLHITNSINLDPNKPLFVNLGTKNFGKRITGANIQRICKQVSIFSDIDFTAHHLRHTFATNLVESGMNPYHVMTLTRLKSMKNLDRYARAAKYNAAEKEFNDLGRSRSLLL